MEESNSNEEPDRPDEGGRASSRELREVVQDLLKNGHVSAARTPAKFAAVQRLGVEIDAALDPLDLRLQIDEIRGLAILSVAEAAAKDPDEEWSHPLVRRQRLTLEQSLLVAILRQHYVLHEQEAGIGVGEVRVALEDLRPGLDDFLGDTGSDGRNEQRLLTLLDQVKPHGIVSEPDKNGEVLVFPLIAHLANPETLATLLEHFRKLAEPSP